MASKQLFRSGQDGQMNILSKEEIPAWIIILKTHHGTPRGPTLEPGRELDGEHLVTGPTSMGPGWARPEPSMWTLPSPVDPPPAGGA